MEEPIIISEWNIQQIDQSATMLIFGPPGSGKTTFMKNIAFFNKHKYPVARVVCSSDGPYKDYCEIFPPAFTFYHFDLDQERHFIENRQKPLSRKRQKNSASEIGKYCMYILDDIDVPKNGFTDPFFSDLFQKGSQHYNQLTLLGNQYVLEFPPAVRSAVTYVVIFRYVNDADREKLYKHFGGIFKDRKTFNKVMNTVVKDYTCIIIKNKSSSNEIKDCVFWYKTKKIPDNWKFGCDEYIKWSNLHCIKKYDW